MDEDSDSDWRSDIREHYPEWETPSWKAAWQHRPVPARVGMRVDGHVISRANFGVWLEIGLSTPALLPVVNTAKDPPFSFDDYPQLGDRLTAWVNAVGIHGEVWLTLVPPETESSSGPAWVHTPKGEAMHVLKDRLPLTADSLLKISERDDAEIAEALARYALDEFRRLHVEVSNWVEGNQSLDPSGTLIYAVASTFSVFRNMMGPLLTDGRRERIKQAVAKCAVAHFVFTTPLGDAVDRDVLHSKLMYRCREYAVIYHENFLKVEAGIAAGQCEAVYPWTFQIATQLCGANPADFDDSELVVVCECVGRAWARALDSVPRIEFEVAAAPRGVEGEVSIEMPKSWRLRSRDPSLYADFATPQYNFLVTAAPPTPQIDSQSAVASLETALSSHPISADVTYKSLSDTKAIAHYRTVDPEEGEPKDDHHWWLFETSSEGTRIAIFTLSVLVARASSHTTFLLAQTFAERIEKASLFRATPVDTEPMVDQLDDTGIPARCRPVKRLLRWLCGAREPTQPSRSPTHPPPRAKEPEEVEEHDEFAWRFPPNTTTDPQAWDSYWKTQLETGAVGLLDIFCDDRELVDFLHREGLRTGLCVGAGLSGEPLALATAGFDITVLELSAFATRVVETSDPNHDFVSTIIDPQQKRDGGRTRFVTGDLRDPTLCPGPYDFIIERRTLQLMASDEADSAIEAVANRLATRGVFVTHCHDGAWRPHQPLVHRLESWFVERGWPRGLPERLTGRCFVPVLSTG